MATPKGTKPWNAGTGKGFLDQRGYRCRKVGKRTIREHRIIMEQHLGRNLEPWEHIHHINGIKTDNRIDNLKLVSAEEHMQEHTGGQRSDQSKRTMAIFRTMRLEIDRLRKTNTDMLSALKAIAIAQKEPAGGDYWTARELANKWGIFTDDLAGERVLLKLVEYAISKAEQAQ
jgi:hypothetical protein